MVSLPLFWFRFFIIWVGVGAFDDPFTSSIRNLDFSIHAVNDDAML